MTNHSFRQSQRRLERGQGLVEYALILVFTSIVVMGVLSLVGPAVADVFCDVSTKLGSDVTCTPPDSVRDPEAEGEPVGAGGEPDPEEIPSHTGGDEGSGSGSGSGS